VSGIWGSSDERAFGRPIASHDRDEAWTPSGLGAGRRGPSQPGAGGPAGSSDERLARFARGWAPEILGAFLAVLTVLVGSQVVVGYRQFEANQAAIAQAQRVQMTRGWLDISVQPVPATTPPGVTVAVAYSWGASAGLLRPGDVISSVDGYSVRSPTALENRLDATSPGTVARLEVVRAGVERTVDVRLGNFQTIWSQLGPELEWP
jgi:hypothetical protein